MRGLVPDWRHAWRMLRRDPWFTAVAALTLALGIGANGAIFSVVHAVLLRPLPYADPDELVMVWESRPREGVIRQRRVSPPTSSTGARVSRCSMASPRNGRAHA